MKTTSKKVKIEDDLKKSKNWRRPQKNQKRRRPKKNQNEDDLKKSKMKTPKKNQNEDNVRINPILTILDLT